MILEYLLLQRFDKQIDVWSYYLLYFYKMQTNFSYLFSIGLIFQ